MRADAQRNYDRLVEVAREVFAEQGYDASLDEVAKRAGVGPGTLYRHFPTRENLMDALMKSWIDRIQTSAEKAAASEQSPRDLLLDWFEQYVAHISVHKGGPAKLTAAMDKPDSPIWNKTRTLVEAMQKVLDRLAADGALRDDVDAVQACRLVGGVAAVADQGEMAPAQVRPLLEIVADGLLR